MSDSKAKIKLVQIIAESNLSGGPRHVLDLLEFVDKNIFDCYLLCPSGDLARQARDIKNITVINTLMRSKYDIIAVYKINRILSEIQAKKHPFNPIIIHTHGPRAGLLGRWAKPPGVYSVYTEHRWDNDYHLENRINEYIQLSLLKQFNYKTNQIIAVSNSVKNFLISHKLAPEERISVVPNAINLKNLNYKTHKPKLKQGNHFIIGTVGSLNHQKGQIYLIEAMEKIIKAYPHLMLEIVGEGDVRGELESRIFELGLERHITLLGRQNNPEKYMTNWDVFVLPSIAETFGIVILEAMNSKIPVIASSVGGITDIIKHQKNGILVPARDVKAIAEAVIDLLSHPAKSAKLVREGAKRVLQYDWKFVVKDIEKVYLNVVSKHSQ